MTVIRPIAFLVALLALAACHKAPSPDELAARAAKAYYGQLISGRYDDFVAGSYLPYRMPDGYRRQLVDNARMFAAQQETEHKGIKKVVATDAKADTVRSVANVYLRLYYGDGTSEEVVVPMVRHNHMWYMR